LHSLHALADRALPARTSSIESLRNAQKPDEEEVGCPAPQLA
jgi:hypothetical protein